MKFINGAAVQQVRPSPPVRRVTRKPPQNALSSQQEATTAIPKVVVLPDQGPEVKDTVVLAVQVAELSVVPVVKKKEERKEVVVQKQVNLLPSDAELEELTRPIESSEHQSNFSGILTPVGAN